MLSTLYNQILYEPLYKFLAFLYNTIPGHDLGIAIIVLTLLIRVILFPLSQKSIKSQMRMGQFKDQIKDIQTKFKSKEEQSRELMKFYKENKIKRQLREIIKKSILKIKQGFDFILIVRAQIINQEFEEIEKEINAIFNFKLNKII